MGFGVHTALLAFRQLSSVTEGFKPCWRTGQSAHLETILFTDYFLSIFSNYCTYSVVTLFFVVVLVHWSVLLVTTATCLPYEPLVTKVSFSTNFYTFRLAITAVYSESL